MTNKEIVTIEKLVHGGQGIGTLADGRRVFVWNALPEEQLSIRIIKSERTHAEAIADEIKVSSAMRTERRDEAYLSTSPWQIMSFAAENNYKKSILTETLQREHIHYSSEITMHTGKNEWHYRNKMEYSFWADDGGLHLALFHRGSHGKQIVPGSSIAMPEIDKTALQVLAILNQYHIRGSQLKTIVVRANQHGETVTALYVKDKSFPEIMEFSEICKGLAVYYSNPKSPASVLTEKLYAYGDITLTDSVLGKQIIYDVHSFFQINLEVFSLALQQIKETIGDKTCIDMYSGVGTIGLSIGDAAFLVDSDIHNIAMAKCNAAGTKATVIHTPVELATEYIDESHTLIVDPPRAGLHSLVIGRILEKLPPKVVYLSCNPSTQARDLALLQHQYEITSVDGYNFFPRTPHIESLAILRRK